MNYNKLIDLILSNNECHLLPLHLVCKLKEEKISIVRNYLVRIKQKLIADDPDKYNQTIENIIKCLIYYWKDFLPSKKEILWNTNIKLKMKKYFK